MYEVENPTNSIGDNCRQIGSAWTNALYSLK